MAKRRLPKVAFDFIEGGLEDERGLDRNTAAFHKHHLLPRYLVDVSKRDQSATIFGQTFSSPFGISPTGSAGLFRRGADMMLAEAAREANIPYIMSGASNDTIEDAARVAPKNAWYQLYAARDGKISDDLIKRTADAGLGALVLTVDVPVHSKRERNMRNGFANIRGNWLQAALSLKPSLLAEAMTHPGWVLEYIRHGGTPALGNWLPYLANGATAEETVKFNRSNATAACSRAAWSSRASWIRATRCAPPISAATGSSCRTTAPASSIRRRPRSTCCRRSSGRSATA
jgi:L-lactate dehydrogenase (cytochrome)/(S)-mandelate dehydrogenase